MFILNKLTGLLPAKLQPYAKALYPALATAAAALLAALNTGVLDVSAIKVAIGGGVLSLLTLGVPNKSA